MLACVCDTHSLVETALACVGLRPGVCRAMAGRAESSRSEVRLRKVCVFRPSTSEPSCSSWPGAVSCGGGDVGVGEAGGQNIHLKKKTHLSWVNFTHGAAGRHSVDDDGSLENSRTGENVRERSQF